MVGVWEIGKWRDEGGGWDSGFVGGNGGLVGCEGGKKGESGLGTVRVRGVRWGGAIEGEDERRARGIWIGMVFFRGEREVMMYRSLREAARKALTGMCMKNGVFIIRSFSGIFL